MNERNQCPCNGTGWVCEFHADLPWEGEGACGCGGAGNNCFCNPNGALPEGFKTICTTEPDKVKEWLQ